MRRIAVALAACALVVAAPAAAAPHVSVVIVSRLDPAAYAGRGAVGLLVPGSGATVTGARALAALERGRVRSSLLGGAPGGRVLVRPSRRPAAITFYVSLPGPGTHANIRRYPIAVVGGGYRGLLLSANTRVPGLVSVADIAPAVVALRSGRRPSLTWRSTLSALADLRSLDKRLTRSHEARPWANVVLVGMVAGCALLSLLLRSGLFARASLLAAPASIITALGLSAAGVTRPIAAVSALLVVAAAASLFAAAFCRRKRELAAALLAVFPIELIVLALSQETSSLAIIGPHPDGGGRFYGITNQVETLLLVPALLGAALLGRGRLAPVLLLSLLTVGAARTGADGGGGVALTAGFLALGLRLYGLRLTGTRLAAIAAASLALAVGFVALDAATGGSSHLSRALGGGTGSVSELVLHRLHVSAAGVVASLGAAVLFGLGVAGLIALATWRPHAPVLDALLVSLGVSLIVNDTPTEIAFYGAVAGLSLWVWSRSTGITRAPSRFAASPALPPAPSTTKSVA